jgi:hypothetical protein
MTFVPFRPVAIPFFKVEDLTMTLQSISSIFLLASAVGFMSGCAVDAPARESASSTSSDLVGGQVAGASEFLSTLHIEGGCTGVKVGPRQILLAAHCVHNPLFNAAERAYSPGKSIRISTGKVTKFQDSSYRTFEIEVTHIPPWWTSSCTRPCVNNMLASSHPADVAVVVVKTDLDQIPTAAIDMRPVRVGDPLVVTGVGCEAGVRGPVDFLVQRQKYQRTRAISEDKLLENPNYREEGAKADVAALFQNYLLTPGQSLDRAQASLCPGDSGGPVYRDDGRGETIVGINSYYSFPPEAVDPNGISDTNWHSRVDAESRDGVSTWLTGFGVAAVRSSAQPHEEPKDSAYARIPGESFGARSGACGRDGEATGAFLGSGGYLLYTNLDFGAPESEELLSEVTVEFASLAPWRSRGKIEFRIDGPTGQVVAEVAAGAARSAVQVRKSPATAVHDKHSVYVVFKGTRPSDAIDLRWFRFESRAAPSVSK